jgi:hypothetical protein
VGRRKKERNNGKIKKTQKGYRKEGRKKDRQKKKQHKTER